MNRFIIKIDLYLDKKEGQDGSSIFGWWMFMGRTSFIKTLPGVTFTEAGRANGTSRTLEGDYDGYAECVKQGLIQQL